jgi:hypothetical protein
MQTEIVGVPNEGQEYPDLIPKMPHSFTFPKENTNWYMEI